MTSRISSGSSRFERAVEPTRSQNITVNCRRSAASVDEGSRRAARRLRRLRRLLRRTNTCDRLEQALAIPQGDAEFFEIIARQFEQDVRADHVIAERGLISTETQAPKPTSDVHGRTQ